MPAERTAVEGFHAPGKAPSNRSSPHDKPEQRPCAECRRLKLKCDRQIPCSTCVRRHCAHLCPNDVMQSTHSSRLAGAQKMSDRLRDKIKELTERVHELEDALALLQSTVSNEQHPLLSAQRRVTVDVSAEPPQEPEHVVNALGSLTIQDREQTFFGRSAGSETILLHVANQANENDEQSEKEPPILSSAISRLSGIFPFLPGGAWDRVEAIYMLLEHLPDRNRSSSLCEIYFQQANWAQRLMSREEVIDELMTPLYKHLVEIEANQYQSLPVSPHQISALFGLFALAALLDLTLPPRNSEAELYHQLARCALELRDIFTHKPEVATIQALSLMAVYHHVASTGDRYSIDASWKLSSVSCIIAQSMGLHRDPGCWNFDPKIVQRRRIMFWEIFCSNLFYSLSTGRPPTFSRTYFDTEYPADIEATVDARGDSEPGFAIWKYKFFREVQLDVVEMMLRAAPPVYSEVLMLDEKIRSRSLPRSLDPDAWSYEPNMPPTHYLRTALLSSSQSLSNLYLHRSFFTQALLDNPKNPLRSKFAPSFLAVSRAASDMVRKSKRHFDMYPELCSRWWHFFVQIFSSAIILGIVVIRIPNSSLAGNSYEELKIAIDLFKHAPERKDGRAIRNMLHRLLEAATKVYRGHRDGREAADSGSNSQQPLPPITDDELAIFGGHTHLRHIESKPPSAGSPSASSGSAAAAPSPPEQHGESAVGSSGNGGSAYTDTSPMFSSSPPGTSPDPLFFDNALLSGVSGQLGMGAIPSFGVPAPPSNAPENDMPFGPSQPQSLPPSMMDMSGEIGMPGDWAGLDAIMGMPYWPAQDFVTQPGWPGSGMQEQQAAAPAMVTTTTTTVPENSGSGYPIDNRSVANAQWMSFLQEAGVISREDGMSMGMMFGSGSSGTER